MVLIQHRLTLQKNTELQNVQSKDVFKIWMFYDFVRNNGSKPKTGLKLNKVYYVR